MFTKEQIATFKEDAFQNKVLIPLFRAMGFRDVKPFGGGILERGKDIVMWKEGELKERVNYGVVVKTVKISGKAVGNGSAAEVLSQARQTLTSSFFDPITSKEQRIDFCWIVSSRSISKEAIYSIEAQLKDSNLDKQVRFLDEGSIYELIDEYLKEQHIFEKLSSSQEELDRLTEKAPYRMVATTENEFLFKEKTDQDGNVIPFKFSIKLRQDQENEEVLRAKVRIDEHFRTGVPIEIEGDFLEIDIPGLPKFMQPDPTRPSKLVLKTATGGQKFPIAIEVESQTGEKLVSDSIDLEIVQQGNEEITLANKSQNTPWKFELKFDFATNSLTFNYTFKVTPGSTSLYQEYQCLRILSNIKKAGTFRIRHLISGWTLFDGPVPEELKGDISDDWIRLLSQLLVIQEKAKIVFGGERPEQISAEEANYIAGVSRILSSGVQTLPPLNASSQFPRSQIQGLLRDFSNGKSHQLIYRTDSISATIWGTEIDLGPSLIIFEAVINDQEIERLSQLLRESQEENFEVQFEPKSEMSERFFLKWLGPEQLQDLSNLVSQEQIDSELTGLFIRTT